MTVVESRRPTEPGAIGRRDAPRRRRRARRSYAGVGFALPAMLLYAGIVLVPFGHGVWISLHEWDGVSPMRWVGLDNFTRAFGDSAVRTAAWHSLVIVVFYAALPIVFGLALAAVMARTRIRGLAMWRAILFMPQAISVVVVGVAWQWLLQQDGPVNQLLRAVGLGDLTRVWLGDFTWALPAEGAIGTWLMTGLCMVLFLSGVQSIDTSLYDAARMDGAGPLAEFFAVTLPGLRRVVAVASVLTLVVALNNFGLIWVTTQGGPGDETEVLATYVYKRAFQIGEIGFASAVAVLVAIVVIVVSFAISRLGDAE